MKSSTRLALVAVLSALSVAARLNADVTYSSVNFSGDTAGSAALGSAGFSVYEYVNPGTGYVGGANTTDPIQGIANSTGLSGTQVGYIGGTTSNNSHLSATASTLEVETFYGAPASSSNISLVRGSANPILTETVKFSISQFNVAQAFEFYMHDAGSATGTGGTGVSEISIGGTGLVSYYNNFSTGANATGLQLIAGDVYSLSISTNFNNDTWSATLKNDTLGSSSAIVTNNSTDGGGYTLSGYADETSSMNLTMYAYNVTNASTIHAALNFDSLSSVGTSAVPEPSTYAAIAAVAVLGFAVLRRRRAIAA